MAGLASADTQDIRAFLRDVPAARNWEPARAVLRALLKEKIRSLVRTTYYKDETIIGIGGRGHLSVIASGNAHLVIPRQDRTGGRYKHPQVLQEGDFIGEFEAFGDRPFMTSVVAGLPFRPPNKSKTKPRTVVLEIPRETVSRSRGCWEGLFDGIARKMSRLNHLLPIVAAGGQRRLTDVIPYFFCGDLPVFRYWVKTPGGALEERSPVPSHVDAPSMGYITLGTISEDEQVRGIETSTTYFGHLGFTNLQKAVNEFRIEPIYWKRMADARSGASNEHHLFHARTEAGALAPQSAECILFFLKSDVPLREYLSRPSARF
jgi:hypothetical protein